MTSVSGYVSRYTDHKTLEIFALVTAGRINKLLVERLQQLGVNAIGLSGLDGRLLEGKRKGTLRIVENGKRKSLRGEYSGKIERVNAGLKAGATYVNTTVMRFLPPLVISAEDVDTVVARTAEVLEAS